MSTEPITQALERCERAGAYHRAARARQLGVPQIEVAALEHLRLPGGLTPGELGHRLGLTSGGVTALTGRLIDAGHVAREPHPAPVREPVEEAIADLTEAEAAVLVRVLGELAERREQAAVATPGPEPVYQQDGYSRALLM
jgi:hypothetical protein